MALDTDLAAQIGYAIETTPGTAVTVSRFFPLVSESINQKIERVESKSIIAGARTWRSAQWAPGNITVNGQVQHELDNLSIGMLLRAMFGAVVTSGAGPYTHTFTPGDLTDDSLTIQIGRPDITGVVQPFTYRGAQVTTWDIDATAGAIVQFALGFAAIDEVRVRTVVDGATTSASPTVTSATANFVSDDVGKPISGAGIPAGTFIGIVNSATSIGLSSSQTTNTPVNATATASGVTLTIGIAVAAASYAAGIKPMVFTGATLSIGGAAANCKKLTLHGDNKLDVNRRFLGAATIKQPLESDLREYTGVFNGEFESLAMYNRFVQGTEAALVATFAAGAQSLAVTYNVRFDGDTPNVANRGIAQYSAPFKAVGASSDGGAVTAVWTTSESTP